MHQQEDPTKWQQPSDALFNRITGELILNPT